MFNFKLYFGNKMLVFVCKNLPRCEKIILFWLWKQFIIKYAPSKQFMEKILQKFNGFSKFNLFQMLCFFFPTCRFAF
jgi:hypothetical protein